MFLTKFKKNKQVMMAVIFLLGCGYLKAQNKAISTAVPFLQVAADARSASMGDQGVATAADVFSQQWNPAKFAFCTEQKGFSISYTP